MANAEDQQDVLAAKMAQAEARVDAAEFDENASFAVTTSSAGDGSKKSGYLRDIESPSDQYVELINSVRSTFILISFFAKGIFYAFMTSNQLI